MNLPRFQISLAKRQATLSAGTRQVNQCQKPTGLLGKYVLWRMNSSHSKLTDWGLSHITITPDAMILDVGCGGGRTVHKLAEAATAGKVCGVDFSQESVRATRKTNARWIAMGRVDVAHASVSALPFGSETFDLVTAVATHFWWTNLAGDLREISRVLKSGGRLALIAEVYKGANTLISRMAEQHAPRTGMTLLSVEEHRDVLVTAGFIDVQIDVDAQKGWICATGRKP